MNTKLAILVLSGLLLICAGAQAQRPFGDVPAMRPPEGSVPTMATLMPDSVRQLLDRNWAVVSHSMGPSLLLRSEASTKHAYCEITIHDGLGRALNPPVSRCWALN